MKSFTDLEQSKRLAEILPLDSADMRWYREQKWFPYELQPYPYNESIITNKIDNEFILPAWSLAALLNVLPDYTLNRCVEYHTIICNGLTDAITASGYNLIDACVEMIEKLNKEGILNKDNNKNEGIH